MQTYIFVYFITYIFEARMESLTSPKISPSLFFPDHLVFVENVLMYNRESTCVLVVDISATFDHCFFSSF